MNDLQDKKHKDEYWDKTYSYSSQYKETAITKCLAWIESYLPLIAYLVLFLGLIGYIWYLPTQPATNLQECVSDYMGGIIC